jgi:hypothetical protein
MTNWGLRFPVSAAAAIAVTGTLLAGCASGSSSAQSTTPPAAPGTTSASAPAATPAASTAASSAAPGGTPGATSGTGAASPPECTAAQLKIQYTDNSQIRQGALAGMSHVDSVVMFTNTGSASCQTGGYPGVAALDSAGRQIMQAIRAPQAAKLLTLAPGAMASALVSADSASCGSPTPVAGLLVTAPNQRTSTRLGPAGQFCLGSLHVGTLQPGNAAGLSL